MLELLGFMVEQSVRNAVPILLGILFAAVLVGRKVVSSQFIRTALYICVGVISGLWAYSTMDIPERTIQFMEAFYLSIGMSLLAAIFVVPAVFFTSSGRRNSESSSDG